MKQPDSVDDIFSFVSQDTGLSRKVVRYAIKNFEKNLSHVLRNPIKFGTEVIITGLCKFTFKIDHALNRLDSLKRYYPMSRDIAMYEELLKDVITNGQSKEDHPESEGETDDES